MAQKRKHHIRRRKNRSKKNQKGGHIDLLNPAKYLGLMAGGLNFLMNPANKNAVLSRLSNVYDKMSNNS